MHVYSHSLDPLENSTTPRPSGKLSRFWLCLDPLENSTTPRLKPDRGEVLKSLDPLENSTTPRPQIEERNRMVHYYLVLKENQTCLDYTQIII